MCELAERESYLPLWMARLSWYLRCSDQLLSSLILASYPVTHYHQHHLFMLSASAIYPFLRDHASAQHAPRQNELYLSFDAIDELKMHSFSHLFIFMLATFYSQAIAAESAGLVPSIDECLSSDQQNCSSTASKLTPIASRQQVPRTTQLPSAEDNFQTQTMLNFLSTPVPTPERTPDPSSAPNRTITPLNLHPPSTQNPLLHSNDALSYNYSHLDRTDIANCRSQSHCLVCTEFNTTLSCYKFNCQCQKGDLRSHYMPASTYSCHRENLCMTCPGRSMPFVWGPMAVCLNMWSHEPVKGEQNPLTGWSQRGLKGNPVGRVEMGDASGLRVTRRVREILALGLVLITCAILA